ncbi:hypothetical protein RUM44_013117 [Polyplax serrata]|uniref:Uncharacterized protein n=1 Tax=Polyplax serrata TaxID=468196 RepID=A0ABR1BGX1_POLSC
MEHKKSKQNTWLYELTTFHSIKAKCDRDHQRLQLQTVKYDVSCGNSIRDSARAILVSICSSDSVVVTQLKHYNREAISFVDAGFNEIGKLQGSFLREKMKEKQAVRKEKQESYQVRHCPESLSRVSQRKKWFDILQSNFNLCKKSQLHNFTFLVFLKPCTQEEHYFKDTPELQSWKISFGIYAKLEIW